MSLRSHAASQFRIREIWKVRRVKLRRVWIWGGAPICATLFDARDPSKDAEVVDGVGLSAALARGRGGAPGVRGFYRFPVRSSGWRPGWLGSGVRG